jgi:hypothetical protein
VVRLPRRLAAAPPLPFFLFDPRPRSDRPAPPGAAMRRSLSLAGDGAGSG